MKSLSETDSNTIYNLAVIGFDGETRKELMGSAIYNDTPRNLFNSLYDEIAGYPYLSKARYIDMNIALEGDMLVKVDRTSMLNSLEARSPFLDYRIVGLVNSLPVDYLVSGKTRKMILTDTFSDLLPKDYLKGKKSGFDIPVGKWLRGSLRSDFEGITTRKAIESQGYLNYAEIKKLYSDHCSGRADNSSKLWLIYCFQKWISKSI